ncbi:MAG: hypothetical protein ABIK83_06395 [Candidatus Zixiibacteriota bacterium]
MTEPSRKSVGSILAANYAVAFILFGSLHFLAPSVTANFAISSESAMFDWLMIVSVMASSWAVWLVMVRQRCVNGLGLWRLLRADLGAASIFFLITAVLFAIAAIKLDIAIPPQSNLIDNKGVSQIVNYCRMPILSHPIALYILITVLTYKIVRKPDDYRRAILIGGLLIFTYYFMMYACGAVFAELLRNLLVFPDRTHLLMMFIFWLPTLLFVLAAYIVYSSAVSTD